MYEHRILRGKVGPKRQQHHMGQKYKMDNHTVVILTKYCEGDKKENSKGDRCYQTLKINFKKDYFTIPTSVQVFNTLKRVKYLKHSYMFLHYNVILREYVVALLKLLYTLMFMLCYHCVKVAW